MSVTVKDILRLPSLRGAKVLGGHSGLNHEVRYATVLEFSFPGEGTTQAYGKLNEPGGGVVITAMAEITQDTEAQCQLLQYQHNLGDVGLLLYYVGVILPQVSDSLIHKADELGLPLICMPENDVSLLYSDAIREITELVIADQDREKYFVPEILQTVISQPQERRSMELLLRNMCSYLKMGFLLADTGWNLLSSALQPRELEGNAERILREVARNISSGTLKLQGKIFSFAVMSVRRRSGADLNLVGLVEGDELSHYSMQQARDSVQIYIGLNGENYSTNETADLIAALLQGQNPTAQRIAQHLHMKLEDYTTLAVIPYDEISVDDAVRRQYREGKEDLQSRCSCIMELYHGAVAILGKNDLAGYLRSEWPTLRGERKERLFLAACNGTPLRIRESYIRICETREAAETIFPFAPVISDYHQKIAAHCSMLMEQTEGMKENPLNILQPLNAFDEPIRSELKTTLEVYLLDAERNFVDTAEMMYLHKNTIKYRIHKVNECLGFDTACMPELAECYLACALERLKSY